MEGGELGCTWLGPGTAEGTQKGLTLNRIEDGSFDPKNPRDFYFVTTEGSPAAGANPPRDGGGVWRVRFDNAEHPEEGGTLTLCSMESKRRS